LSSKVEIFILAFMDGNKKGLKRIQSVGEKWYTVRSLARGAKTESKKMNPRRPFRFPDLTVSSSSRLVFSASPNKVFKLLFSAEYFCRASSPGHLLRPLGVQCNFIHENGIVKIPLADFS
jgi:hypothetical protein